MNKKRFALIKTFTIIICIIALTHRIANLRRSDSLDDFSIEDVYTNVSVSFGLKHGAAITANGDLYTWGSNSSGQLGHGEKGSYVDTPTKVPGISDVVSVNLGEEHSVAITTNGDLYTWGRNLNGRLGHGSAKMDISYIILPTKVMDMANVVAINAAGDFTTAITEDGELHVLGFSNFILVRDFTSVVSVSLSHTSSIFGNVAVIDDSGKLYTGGYSSVGLGYGIRARDLRRMQIHMPHMSRSVPKIRNVIAVSLGEVHGAAITSDGALYTWGLNWNGQVGHGSDRTVEPTRIRDITNVVAVSLGENHSAAVTANGALYTWGYNRSGQLGYNSFSYNRHGFQYTDTPTKVPGLTDVVAVSLGYYYSAAITANGSLYTWGSTYGGALGDGVIGERWDFRQEPQKIMENVMIPNTPR